MQIDRTIHAVRKHNVSTSAKKVTKWLNTAIPPCSTSGTGVLAVNEAGELIQGQRLPEAFVWGTPSATAQRAFDAALDRLYRLAA